MEHVVLEALEYEIITNTSQIVLWELIQNCTNLTLRSVHLALYILELSMQSCSYRKYEPKILALASIYLCSKIQ